MFWLVVGGAWGPVLLVGYAFLRAWQGWLAKQGTPMARAQSGVDGILHVLDWIPVRLAGPQGGGARLPEAQACRVP